MTGAGTSTVAYGIESSFMGSVVDDDTDSSPDYYLPGKNVTIEEIELSNQLQRIRDPDSVESVESIEGNLEGAFSASWIAKHWNHHNFIFNDAGTGFAPGLAASSRWYLGIDYLTGTAERELIGVVPTQYQIRYEQGGPVRVSVTCIYADEKLATSITPSTIEDPGTVYQWHGTSLDVNTTTQAKLQSSTLQISNIARFQRGSGRKPIDAVIAAPEASLSADTTMTETDQLALAYGAAGSTAPQDSVGGVSASFAVTNGGGTTKTFNLSEVTPDTYNWSDLVSAENDMNENLDYQVNGVTVA
ncbi:MULTISPECIES: phage tail tube protein [Halorussus]|uniref:phage tail tube protein n=1 Tax=Halorussus TaxID=1070314 RepID=UPI00209ED173|nr:phage tail tube protein [Halorussus vallis]USZ75665.1 phage tail tube protein [Halorussus vallis]USZ75720.1 phage tail tube protein [Halorussus vallis]USZ75738.1 phage tail tube protein [Halorussus vallis]